MRAVIGLGNKGRRFCRTRHNVGFLLLKLLAEELKTDFFLHECSAEIAKACIESEELLLVRPYTLMNVCGKIVYNLLQIFCINADDMIVVHDDCSLPFGRIKIKRGGGSGGHKGLESIIEWVGPRFLRLRIGIGRGREPLHEYVLKEFCKREWEQLPAIFTLAKEALFAIVRKGEGFAMTKYNR
jgi:PTH1 family peptidyl-tRNA hydrolase